MSRANEPAYPVVSSKRDEYAGRAIALVTSSGGLTLREHFAGLAMAARRNALPGWTAAMIASHAVADADALIAELSKEPTK